LEGFHGHGGLVAPDFFGIVLDPTRLGIELAMFALGTGDGATGGVEEDGPGAGGALIEG
jgi:hypothetical protein